jgi:uncharacterized coiled-coil protein SlyX
MLGIVNHSAEGYFGASPSSVMRARGNSWHLTIYRSGHVVQSYPLEALCWHAGSKANYRYIGIEHEGKAGEPLTTAQLASSIKVNAEIARLRGWASVRRGVTGFEHNDFMATSCPSGRIPWSKIEAGTRVATPTIWGDVREIAIASVTLYEDTNLVRLPDKIFVKKLFKSTQLSVKGVWKGTYYITSYSFDRKIPNGFAVSSTVAPPPPIPPPSFWDDVEQINQGVTLYRDTNLRELDTGKFVKLLTKGTRLSVKGLWNNTDYITTYSFDNKIKNGFSVSATIDTSPTDPCEDIKTHLEACKSELDIINAELAKREITISSLNSQIRSKDAKIMQLNEQINALTAELSAIGEFQKEFKRFLGI